MCAIEVVVSVLNGLGRTGIRFGIDQNSLTHMFIDVLHAEEGEQ